MASQNCDTRFCVMGMTYESVGAIGTGGRQYTVRCDRCRAKLHTGKLDVRGAAHEMQRFRGWKRVVVEGADVFGKIDESAWWLCPECVRAVRRAVRRVVNAPAG